MYHVLCAGALMILCIAIPWSHLVGTYVRDLYHSTALVEVANSLVLSNIIGQGKVPYLKPWLKSMAHGVHSHIAQCISAMHGENST